MKEVTTIRFNKNLLEKIDALKTKWGTNRSETLHQILDEYFTEGNFKHLLGELERLKLQNIELRYQLQDVSKSLTEQNKQIITMLLIIGGTDKKVADEMRARFPQFWKKPT